MMRRGGKSFSFHEFPFIEFGNGCHFPDSIQIYPKIILPNIPQGYDTGFIQSSILHNLLNETFKNILFLKSQIIEMPENYIGLCKLLLDQYYLMQFNTERFVNENVTHAPKHALQLLIWNSNAADVKSSFYSINTTGISR